MSKICEFYSGKNVLITGATGFCGKVLVEKLLRSCENIGKIFLVVRKKKKASTHERYIDYVNHFIFDKVRAKNATCMQKIIFINGDITLDELALSSEDQKMLAEEVNIVFHCAANVRFNDPVKEAVNINTTGTLRLLQLAEKMKNLEVFSYMSTAFCQSYQTHLEERYYPSGLDANKIIDITNKLDDEGLQNLELDLFKTTKHPNTYTLSKALAEDIVYSFRKKLPIVIIRPSQVWYAMEEPFPGFVEGMHSGIGIICGVMTGCVRTMYVADNNPVKITPADYIINATIVSCWKKSTVANDDLLIYNCSDSSENILTWEKTDEVGMPHVNSCPSYENALWLPNISYTSNFIWHRISLYLFQLLPAILFDIIQLLSGNKTKLVTLQRKIMNGMNVLYFFTTHNFNFETKKLNELFDGLEPDEQKKFYFDHRTIDWSKFFENGIHQSRRLLLKEDDSTLPQGIIKRRKLYYYDLILKAFLAFAFVGLLWKIKEAVF